MKTIDPFVWTFPKEQTVEDKLIMYLIVRESLNMSVGKIAAQVGHAVQLINIRYHSLNDKIGRSDEETNMIHRYNFWVDHNANDGFTKIVCKASDKEWELLKLIYKPTVVVDAGKTEVAPMSETVMSIFPVYKEERDKILKRLRLL